MGVGGSIDAGRGNTDDVDVEELEDMLEQVPGRESKRDTGRGIEWEARITHAHIRRTYKHQMLVCPANVYMCVYLHMCVCVHVGTHAQPPNMKQRERPRSRHTCMQTHVPHICMRRYFCYGHVVQEYLSKIVGICGCGSLGHAVLTRVT